MMKIELEAVKLFESWYVRPKGALGSCGFYPRPWEITYIPKANGANDAIRKAHKYARWL
jgi:hypothetical protein